jgi:glutamyl-tRNA reductase
MILLAAGLSYRTAPVSLRERLVFTEAQLGKALEELEEHFNSEAVLLSTCNRIEVYLGRIPEDRGTDGASFDGRAVADFLAGFHGLEATEVWPHMYAHHQAAAIAHLFRVAASLDSLIVGEGQIAGQVKRAFECADQHAAAGTLMHTMFRHARQVARRVRTETGISQGHVSVSSAAVEYVREVFDHFGDKTVLVIGAGKMGELTLRHLRALRPRRICVTNRSPERAAAVAQGCGGEAVPWDQLDDLLARADIVLSTTGAPEPIVTLARFQGLRRHRTAPLVILDIAVPRDFDPRIHDGDQTFLFNIDDLQRVREATLAARLKHVAAAQAIVDQEVRRFLEDWARRRNGPVIARLTQEFEAKRQEVQRDLFSRLNGKLTEADRRQIEGAFRVLQNRILHGPISALAEESHHAGAGSHTLLEALRKLFRLEE